MLPLIEVHEEEQKPLNKFALQLLEHIEKTPAKENIWNQPPVSIEKSFGYFGVENPACRRG